MTNDIYGKVTYLTHEILEERGYFNSSSMGLSMCYDNKNDKRLSFWTHPAHWFNGRVEVFWGGHNGKKVTALHELLALEEMEKNKTI